MLREAQRLMEKESATVILDCVRIMEGQADDLSPDLSDTEKETQ